MKHSLAALLLLVLAGAVGAQPVSGDIRQLDSPDRTRGYPRFTARCVGESGELYIQQGSGSTAIDVYADVDAFMASALPVRSMSFPGLTGTGPMITWVDGTIYGSNASGGGSLGRWDPNTGQILPTSISQGFTSPAWGGGTQSMIACDGLYFYVLKDSTLEIYDLQESLLSSVTMPASIGTYTTAFAAGGYFYPVIYAGQSRITDRVNGTTGQVQPFTTNLNVPCEYQVCASFNYFEDILLHTGGNASGGCDDYTFVYDDVQIGGPEVRTVSAPGLQVAPGQTGVRVTVDVENPGANGVDVTKVALFFRDPGGLSVNGDYVVVPDPGNPTTIAAGATETFELVVDVQPMALLGQIAVDARIEALDQVTTAYLADSGADTPDSWEVVSAVALIRDVISLESTVTPGSTGHLVTVTVESIGLSAILVFNVGLTFVGTIDRTSDYIVTPNPSNPGTIGGLATATFRFQVDVSPAAAQETIVIDAAFAGLDTVTGGLIFDADADTTDTWSFGICAIPVCGDCNGDSMLSILDALVAAQHAAGLITLAGANFSACNVLGLLEPAPGASVDVLDALAIAQRAAGLPVALACC